MKDEERGSLYSYMIPALFGAGIAVLISTVLLFAVGALIYSTDDPNKYVTAAAIAIMLISSVASGFAGSKKGEGLLPGVIAGTLYAFILFAVSLFFDGNESGSFLSQLPYSILFRLIEIALAALGAFLASKTGGRGRSLRGAPKAPKIKRI